MYTALGHFTVERDTPDCYLVYDHYDFNGLYFPVAFAERFGAKTFDVHASGEL